MSKVIIYDGTDKYTKLEDDASNSVPVTIKSPLEANGSLPVTLQDQTTPPVILPMSKTKNVPTTTTVATAIDDYTITLASVTGYIDGNYIALINDELDQIFLAYQVGAPAGNVITLDRPLDYAFPIGSVVHAANTNMNVDGSVTPQIFSIRGGEISAGIPNVLDITRVMLGMRCDSAADLSTFGNLAALTKGITLRKTDGSYYNIVNWKTNGEIGTTAFDMTIHAATNPIQGVDGVLARLTFGGQNKMGVVVRLGPTEDLELIINDDLTDLVRFGMLAEGHIAII